MSQHCLASFVDELQYLISVRYSSILDVRCFIFEFIFCVSFSFYYNYIIWIFLSMNHNKLKTVSYINGLFAMLPRYDFYFKYTG